MTQMDRLPTEVVIYTDGGTEPNPGPGGWAAILLFEDKSGRRHERELYGAVAETTNNRMEITAMLEGLKALSRSVHVTVYTDSQYLKNGIGNWDSGKPTTPGGWIVGWKKLGWRRKDGPLLNDDLWQLLWEACERHKSVRMRWVRGHSGDHYNERCDVLAMEARTGSDWRTIEEGIMDDD